MEWFPGASLPILGIPFEGRLIRQAIGRKEILLIKDRSVPFFKVHAMGMDGQCDVLRIPAVRN